MQTIIHPALDATTTDMFQEAQQTKLQGIDKTAKNQDENSWSYPTESPNQLWSGSGSSYDPYIIKTAQDLENLMFIQKFAH